MLWDGRDDLVQDAPSSLGIGAKQGLEMNHDGVPLFVVDVQRQGFEHGNVQQDVRHRSIMKHFFGKVDHIPVTRVVGMDLVDVLTSRGSVSNGSVKGQDKADEFWGEMGKRSHVCGMEWHGMERNRVESILPFEAAVRTEHLGEKTIIRNCI